MKTRQAIIPGLILSILSLTLATNWIASPHVLWQSSSSINQDETTSSTSQATNLSQSFPSSIQIWKDLIISTASQHNLDPNLIAAVILQESGGDASAYSSSGAVGLLQVMPRDGLASEFICGSTPCFQSRPSIQELFDPQFNIAFGTQMLSGLFNHYGNWREALRAYGPMDVGYDYADIVLSIYENYRS